MTDYGIQPVGFVRKPLAVILQEIEARNRTEFGANVIQDPDTGLGQINGLLADAAAKVWELAEDVYQSVDPDQAEGMRLDMLGRIRLLTRATDETDMSYRQGITNNGEARIDVQDIERAVASLPGVTYCHVFENNGIDTDPVTGMPGGSLCIAVTGGDDNSVANAIRSYVVPGIRLGGNTVITGMIDGYCRTLRVLRPTYPSVDLTVRVRLFNDANGCPPPSTGAVAAAIKQMYLINGEAIDHFKIRSIVESQFAGVEVISFVGEKDEVPFSDGSPITMAFTERATLDDVTVTPV